MMEIKFLNKKIIEEKILEKENELFEPMVESLKGKLHLFITGMVKATTPEAHNYYCRKAIDFAYDPIGTWNQYLEELSSLPKEWNFKIEWRNLNE